MSADDIGLAASAPTAAASSSSFAVAANEKYFVIAANTTIVLVEIDTASCRPLNSLKFETSQIVQAVTIVKWHGIHHLVVAGDSKMLVVFRIPQSRLTSADVSWTLSPSLTYGPHTKRIVHIAGDGEDGLVLADKFGEVYRLDFKNAAPPALGGQQQQPVATFLLQHFSLITTLLLTSQRLITCDRDCHVRVSCYPAVYDIDTFLWSEPPQAMKLCAVELHSGELVTGDSAGRVHSWRRNSSTGTYDRRLLFTVEDSSVGGEAKPCDDARGAAANGVVLEFRNAVTSIVLLEYQQDASALLCTTHGGDIVVIVVDIAAQKAAIAVQSTFYLPPFGRCALGKQQGTPEGAALALSRTQPHSCIVVTRNASVAVVSLDRSGSVQVTAVACEEVGLLSPLLTHTDLVAHYASSFDQPQGGGDDGEKSDDGGEAVAIQTADGSEAVEGSATKKKKRVQ